MKGIILNDYMQHVIYLDYAVGGIIIYNVIQVIFINQK